jgi:hypothetical protein
MLVVAARNMPRAVAPITGAQLLSDRLLALAQDQADDYAPVVQRLTPAQRKLLLAKLGRRAPDASVRGLGVESRELGRDKVLAIEKARVWMPPRQHDRVGKLLQASAQARIVARDPRVLRPQPDSPASAQPTAELTRRLVHDLGPREAARVVPTLEVYVYYQPGGGAPVYRPMTSFSVFLSHEGDLTGMSYGIEGARQVRPNVYLLQVPREGEATITVRASTSP